MEKKHDNEIVINTTDDNKEKSLSEIQEKLKSTEYMNSIKGMSSTLSQLSKSLIDMHNSIMPSILNQNTKLYSTLDKATQIISDYQKNIISDVIKNSIGTSTKLSETIKSIINSYDFNNIINVAVSSKLQTIIQQLSESLKPINLGDLSGYETEYLKKRFWVIPFEYEYKNVKQLTDLSNKGFNNEMLKYFNKSRVNRLFTSCIKKETKSDKKKLLRQVKQNYILGNFSICNVALITYLDSLSLKFIDSSSRCQHKSHEVVNNIHQYYEDHDTYQMYLKAEILKNFYDILYDNENNLKNPNSKTLNRHLASHGTIYSDNKIDTLRLINAIWYIQSFTEETDFIDKFIYESKGKEKGYKLKETRNSQ